MVLFQVLVILTTGAAASTVYDYPDDGVRAFKNLERMIRRTTAVNAIPDLRRRINAWTIPTGKDPSTAFTKLRSIQRELAALLPTYDITAQLADIKSILTVDYAIPVSLTPFNADPDILITACVNHYESFLTPTLTSMNNIAKASSPSALSTASSLASTPTTSLASSYPPPRRSSTAATFISSKTSITSARWSSPTPRPPASTLRRAASYFDFRMTSTTPRTYPALPSPATPFSATSPSSTRAKPTVFSGSNSLRDQGGYGFGFELFFQATLTR